jgi:hypothetical protein
MACAVRAENRKKRVTRYSVVIGLSDKTISVGMVVPRAAALELAAEQAYRDWAAAQNAPD